MAFATFVLAWSAIAFALIWLWRHLKLRRQLSTLPSPRSWPLFGHGLIIKPDVEGFTDQLMAMAFLYPEPPRIVLLWAGFNPMIMVYAAESAEKIFSDSSHLNKGMLYDMLKPWLGNGLLTRQVCACEAFMR